MFKVRKLDRYIIGKFLGTFFFAITLLMFITVIFDLSEKLDEFMENEAPPKLIITNYYFNFVPYFAVLFTPLFTFISVIFFTSRMAYNTEIIAMLSSGVSFRRLLVPYIVSAVIIMGLNIYLVNYVIPKANAERFQFEEQYYHHSVQSFKEKNVHRQIDPGVIIYLESYHTQNDYGQKFSVEKYSGDTLVSKLISKSIRWDSTIKKWNIRDYFIRDYHDGQQTFQMGESIDTVLNMKPEDFRRRDNAIEAMNRRELNEFIDKQKLSGASQIDLCLVEKHKRVSFPFSTIILSIIGVSVSSRKVRGGVGMHIGIGLLVASSYILFMQFSTQFSIGGNFPPFLAVWTPNIIFGTIAALLYRIAPK
ncbi:MAG: LptF/LptG family permease [Bacteroidales bacterium]|nr:LptF/LptG family permease [Bacteroidales bacterium]